LQLFSPGSSSGTSRSFHSRRQDPSWKFSAGLLISLILIAYRYARHRPRPVVSMRPEWEWDLNVYTSREEGYTFNPSERSKHRNLLLVQVAGNPVLNELVDITSRPNRAYANQWRRDYVRYSNNKASTLDMTCVDEPTVLNTILERQRYESDGWRIQQQRSSYDVVALLPADAVVRDLDFDLLELLPDDKLVALAGWKAEDPWTVSGSRINVIFFNLRHRHADRVAKAWSDAVQAKRVTCGTGREVSILLHAIQSILESDEELHAIQSILESDEELSSLIYPLDQTDQGFVGDGSNEFAIKALVPTITSSSKAVVSVSSMSETAATLHTTADSVCYRYYPKCEVL
jgi:hypothetical protein